MNQRTDPQTTQRRIDRTFVSQAMQYLYASLAVGIATLARIAFDKYLNHTEPYFTFYVATAAAAGLLGLGPSLMSVLLGFLVGFCAFVEPCGSFTSTSVADSVGIATYFIVSLPIAFFGHRMRKAREQAVARQRDLEREAVEHKKDEDALRESEERYRQVVQNTTAIILRVDTENARIKFANDHALRFFGYTEDELVGKPAVGTIIPERESTGRDLVEMTKSISADPDGYRSNINENMRKNGERVWLEWTNTGIRRNDGKISEYLSVGIDITARKQAEQKERELEAGQREFYRRTIMSATQGKLVIMQQDEVLRLAGPSVASWDLQDNRQLRGILREATRIARSAGMDRQNLHGLMSCVGESASNALKHAGGGTASMHLRDDSVLFVVSDHGPGIDALNIPNLALEWGYSTAGTGGLGYKLMLKMADKVYLATGPTGTTAAFQIALRSSPADAEPAPLQGITGLSASPIEHSQDHLACE
jgi:PAS domain S-box-containing protein